jgi:hypothetical protein
VPSPYLPPPAPGPHGPPPPWPCSGDHTLPAGHPRPASNGSGEAATRSVSTRSGDHRHRQRWIAVRRWLALIVATVIALAGVTTIAAQLWAWLDRTPPTSSPAGPSDVEFAGLAAAAAVAYLSWDEHTKSTRRTTLAWATAPDQDLDGWDGTGRQHADSPAVLGIARTGPEAAAVTVRARVLPGAAPPPPAPPADGSGAAGVPTEPQTSTVPPAPASSTAPVRPTNSSTPPASGRERTPAHTTHLEPNTTTPAGSRWLTLAVPLARIDGRLVVTASPVLLGSPVTAADLASSAGATAPVDPSEAARTRDTVSRLIAAYAADDLDFVRAPHTTFTGLDGVALDRLTDWRVIGTATTGSVLTGRATVVWALPEAGRLRCTYQLRLHRHDDRWLLAAVLPVLETTP